MNLMDGGTAAAIWPKIGRSTTQPSLWFSPATPSVTFHSPLCIFQPALSVTSSSRHTTSRRQFVDYDILYIVHLPPSFDDVRQYRDLKRFELKARWLVHHACNAVDVNRWCWLEDDESPQ